MGFVRYVVDSLKNHPPSWYFRRLLDGTTIRVYVPLALLFIGGWEALILAAFRGSSSDAVVGLECLAIPIVLIALLAWIWKRGDATMRSAKHVRSDHQVGDQS